MGKDRRDGRGPCIDAGMCRVTHRRHGTEGRGTRESILAAGTASHREVMGEEADTYIPLVSGGINLSKLCGVMHDTCNSANAIARRVRVLRDESGSELYGEEEWRRMLGLHEREWLDFL
jgi:hypothetical protein